MKVNQKIWKVEINFFSEDKSKSPFRTRNEGVIITELKILGISKYKIVLDNDYFTTLDVKREDVFSHKYSFYVDTVVVDIRTKDDVLGNGVFAFVYSTEKPSTTLLNKMYKEISNQIDKEYGFLFNGVKASIQELVSNYEFKNQ
jgi:hypothetical protein